MKRTRLRPVSDKRRQEWPAQAEVRAAVFKRDGYRCQVGSGCFGPLTYHHLRKASQGGKFTVENGATLCSFHNGLVEDDPVWGRERGLVR